MERLQPAGPKRHANIPAATQKQKSEHHEEAGTTHANKSHGERRGVTETKGSHLQHWPASLEAKSRKCKSPILLRQSAKRQSSRQHHSPDSVPSDSKSVPEDKPKSVFHLRRTDQSLKSARNRSPSGRRQPISDRQRMHSSQTNTQEKYQSVTSTETVQNNSKEINPLRQTRENVSCSISAKTEGTPRSRQRPRSAGSQMSSSLKTRKPVQQDPALAHSAATAAEADGREGREGEKQKTNKNADGHQTSTPGKEASTLSGQVSSPYSMPQQLLDVHENLVTKGQKEDKGKEMETDEGDGRPHTAQAPKTELQHIERSQSGFGESVRARCHRHINKPLQQGHSSKAHAFGRRKLSPADDFKERRLNNKIACAVASVGHDTVSTAPRYPNYLRPKSGLSQMGKSYAHKIFNKCRINVTKAGESDTPPQELEKEKTSDMKMEDRKTNKGFKVFVTSEDTSLIVEEQDMCKEDDMGAVESYQSSQELSDAKGASSQNDDQGTEESSAYDPDTQPSASAKNSGILPAGDTSTGAPENVKSKNLRPSGANGATSPAKPMTKPSKGGRPGEDHMKATDTDKSKAKISHQSRRNQLLPADSGSSDAQDSTKVEEIRRSTPTPPYATAHTAQPARIADENGEVGFMEDSYPDQEEIEHSQQVVELSNFYHTVQHWRNGLLAMHASLDRSPFDGSAQGTCSICHKEGNILAPRDNRSRRLVQPELRQTIPQLNVVRDSEECADSVRNDTCEEPLRLHISYCRECRELVTAPLQQSFHILMDDMDLLLDTLEIFHLPDRPKQDYVPEEVDTDYDNRSSSCQEIASGKDWSFLPQPASSVQSQTEVKRDVLDFVSESKLFDAEENSLTSIPVFKPVCCSSETLGNRQYLNRRMCSETATIMKRKQITKQDHFRKTLEYFSDSCLANCYIIHRKPHKEPNARHSTPLNGQPEHGKAVIEVSVGQKQEKSSSLQMSNPHECPESDETKHAGKTADDFNNGQLNISREEGEAKHVKYTHEMDGSSLPTIVHNPDLVPVLPLVVSQMQEVMPEPTPGSEQLVNRRNRLLGKFLLRYIRHIENRLVAVQSQEECNVKYPDSSQLLPERALTAETVPTVMETVQAAEEGLGKRPKTLVKLEHATGKSASLLPIIKNKRADPEEQLLILNPEVSDFSPPTTPGTETLMSRDVTSPSLEPPTVKCTSSCVSVTGSEEGERGKLAAENDSKVEQAFSNLGHALQNLAHLMDVKPVEALQQQLDLEEQHQQQLEQQPQQKQQQQQQQTEHEP